MTSFVPDFHISAIIRRELNYRGSHSTTSFMLLRIYLAGQFWKTAKSCVHTISVLLRPCYGIATSLRNIWQTTYTTWPYLQLKYRPLWVELTQQHGFDGYAHGCADGFLRRQVPVSLLQIIYLTGKLNSFDLLAWLDHSIIPTCGSWFFAKPPGYKCGLVIYIRQSKLMTGNEHSSFRKRTQ